MEFKKKDEDLHLKLKHLNNLLEYQNSKLNNSLKTHKQKKIKWFWTSKNNDNKDWLEHILEKKIYEYLSEYKNIISQKLK